jgi:hypothetical protein
MIVTPALLRKHGACHEQYTKFRTLFPKGVIVTKELCIAHASDFDFTWAAQHLFPPAASAEYERVHAPAYAEYKRVRAAASAEFERVRAAARAEYERVHAAASAEYDLVCAAALAEYDRVRAAAFGEIAETLEIGG